MRGAGKGTAAGEGGGWGVEAEAESRRPRGRGRRNAPQRPGGGRGGPAVLSSEPPAAPARRQRSPAAEGSLGPAAAPARPAVSNFLPGEADRGRRGSPPPPPLEAAGEGGLVHWGSKGLTILLGCRRLAWAEKSVGAQTGSRRKRRRRPSCAQLRLLRPSGRPRGRGCGLGEGKRRRGARTGRMTGHAGSGGGKEKLRSRFRDRESGRRDGEKGKRQKGRGEGREEGQAGQGLQPRARALSGAVTDSLQWLALTRNLKARKRGRAGEGGESGAQRGGGRGRAEPAAEAGLP